MSQEQRSSYKNIVKATAVFGGAQVIEVLITVIRAKFIAVILGPEGMGINSMLQSCINPINQLTGLGIFQSGVRDISQANSLEDKSILRRTISIFIKWVTITAVFGMFVAILFSPLLSEITFGNKDYTFSFVFLSLALLLMSLSNGNITLLQGTHQLVGLAKSSMYGAAISLLIAIPLFYLLGNRGIVPSIIAGYLALYIMNSHYASKLKTNIVRVSFKEAFSEGKDMVKLGVTLMAGGVFINVFTYLVNAFIRYYGSMEDVGLFQSAFLITNRNFLILASVLAADYFPRLAAVCNSKEKINIAVNQQTELLSLLVSCLSVVLIVFSPLIVRLLLSEEFLVIVPLIRWMALGLIFRVIWLSVTYIALAKGDKKTYLLYDAIIGNGINFILNVVAYKYWGLNGLGISFVVGSIVMSVLLTLVVKWKYNFVFNTIFIRIFIIVTTLTVLTFICSMNLSGILLNLVSITLLVISLFYTYYVLNKRMDINKLIKWRIKKRR